MNHVMDFVISFDSEGAQVGVEMVIFCINYERNTMATNFEPHKCVIFVQSTKISSHENKVNHSN